MGERRVLSSIDLLPEEAEADRVWAFEQLNANKRTQLDILAEFNVRLAAKGIGPISKSAFNRTSMRVAKRARRLKERRDVYAGIAADLTPAAIGESDLVLGEFMKTLLDELLDGEDIDTKGAMELAKAYKEVIVGQRHSMELRAKSEKLSAERDAEADKKATEKLGEVVKTVGREMGMSQATVDAINRKIAGIAVARPPEAA